LKLQGGPHVVSAIGAVDFIVIMHGWCGYISSQVADAFSSRRDNNRKSYFTVV